MKKLIITLITLLLTACSGTNNNSNVEQTSTEISIFTPATNIIETLTNLYTSKNPETNFNIETGEINSQVAFDKNYTDKLNASIMSGTNAELIQNYGLKIENVSNKSYFADFKELIDKDINYKNTIYPNVFEAFEIDGKIYEFPIQLDYFNVAINKNAPDNIKQMFNSRENISYNDLMDIYEEYRKTDDEFYLDINFSIHEYFEYEYSNYFNFGREKFEFDTEKFIDTIKRCKENLEPDKNLYGRNYIMTNAYSDDKVIASEYLFTTVHNTFLQYYFDYSNNSFENPKPLVESSEGKLVVNALSFVMASNSKNIDKCYSFLKFTTSLDDYFDSDYLNKTAFFVPRSISYVNKNANIKNTKKLIETRIDSFEEENGVFIEKDKEEAISNANAKILNIMEMPMKVALRDEYQMILTEELQDYQIGLITAEKATENIKNKFEIMSME